LFAGIAPAQPPPSKKPAAVASPGVAIDSKPQGGFESRVRAEWEALKNKDKKVYSELLADDYEGVEEDGKGERNRIQAINEVPQSNVFDFTLWGFRVTPIGPDAAFVIYEVTMQFPPQSVIRYSRVYVSELWIKQNGDWKVLHYQETHVK